MTLAAVFPYQRAKVAGKAKARVVFQFLRKPVEIERKVKLVGEIHFRATENQSIQSQGSAV